MANVKKIKVIRKCISILLVIAILFTSIGLEKFTKTAEAAAAYTKIYLKDDTAEHWIGNDNAVIELVDNTYGHDHYIMTKEDSTTWSARVPSSTYNVTFNRLSPDKSTQWNSWSAGGRGSNVNDKNTWHSTYHATVPEHGYWDGEAEYEEGFHEGDVIYLDYYEFNSWEISNALFYVNFTDASKTENNGADIDISTADKNKYSPILLTNEIEEQVYTYTVTAEDEGAAKLKFWRGNSSTLWNDSVTLSYSDYQAGNNCVKVQGWNSTGYVCPYVPRRHIPVFDTLELNVTGNQKVNRKIVLDFDIQGETQYLNTEDTQINIVKIDSEGNIISDNNDEYLLFDDNAAAWNHRELIFKESGKYRITAIATDGTDEFIDEKIITVVNDQAPAAGIELSNPDDGADDDNIFVRNSEGVLNLNIKDTSSSELGDSITSRIYRIYYDANGNSEYEDDEIISETTGNRTEVSLSFNSVGKYKVMLDIQETFTDTIVSLINESDYLTGETEREFEIVNQAPVSSMSVKKSKAADIIFTVGNADSGKLAEYAAASEMVKNRLDELGIEANVSTVSTSALTATDTFAWREYDHCNFNDWGQVLPNHIQYTGKDIKMVGYFYAPFKDFLYVNDNDSNKKIFEFDLQRDTTDWHSMEGGGFLFNTVVSDEENYIQGYCILVTAYGLKLVQINKTDLTNFRNNTYYVQNAGRLLQTFPLANLYDSHHFKIIINNNTITVYDGDNIIINEYVLPDDGVDAYGYGPITSHESHGCYQQSYFTFKNIVMQTVTGESLSDVVNNHQWTPGDNHYVVNLSETSVPELSDNDRMSDVSAALISNNVSFYGIGTDTVINQYNTLLNAIDGMGENIVLPAHNDNENDSITVTDAVGQIVSSIIADISSKDYEIDYVISSDEKVEYTDAYYDPEGDEKGEEVWRYEYNPAVFGENRDEIQTLEYTSPITMFSDTGAYTITHKVRDDVAGYSLWSDEDSYRKLILSQHRPMANITVDAVQSKDDSNICLVNVQYSSYDEDHINEDSKGIRKEEFYYKELGDTAWTEGRFPASVTMGATYLVKYIVTDVEGTKSRPSVAAVKTKEAREYTEPSDTNPPTVNLTVSDTTVEIGSVFYVEASAEDDYGITEFSIKHGEEEIGSTYGRFECSAAESGEYVITVYATDIGGNTVTDTKTVTVIDSSDVAAPTIDITSPVNGAICGDTDIVGTIKDDKGLKTYKVTRTKITSSESGSTEENESVVIASGTNEVIDDVIATIETDDLDGDLYKYDITAEDMAGHITTVTCTVRITKDNSDRIPPAACVTDIVLDSENGTISVYGSVSDDTGLSRYDLYLKKAGNSDDAEVIGSGSSGVNEGILGTIYTENLDSTEYSLRLVAIDKNGNTCENTAGFTFEKAEDGNQEDINVNPDIAAPVIMADLKAAIADGKLKIDVSGTIDDENLVSYDVITGKYDDNGELAGSTCIAAGTAPVINGDIASYTYETYETGNYGVHISAVDEAGNLRTVKYTVTINSKGIVDTGYSGEDDSEQADKDSLLNLTLSKTTADVDESINAYLSYPQSATDVTLTAEGAAVNLSGRSAVITSSNAGEITVRLHAVIDGEEKAVEKTVRFFDRGDNVHPTADFISPEPDSDLNTKTDIYATIKDETGLAYYILDYKEAGGSGGYREISRGTDSVENEKIGELDTTLLMNGSYILRITAVDNGGNRIRAERTVNVTGNLKVGNMSLGFTDINSSVAGIPLTVTRNYDSRNKSSGDFGTGWTLGLQSAAITESNDITQGYKLIQQGDRLSTCYYMEQTVNHDITVTYGDGTSDRFELKVTPERSALIPIYEVEVTFRCVTDKKVKLELDGGNQALVAGGQLIFEAPDMLEKQNYVLTRADGTKLYLSPEYGLLKMEDTNGNTVKITKNGYKHSSGNSVIFTRDGQGRITKAEEKNSAGDVINSITYSYDNDDNLAAVTDTAGRTVMFTYDSDHNMVDIIDPSGIAVARNIYDEDGRLTATVDADGNRIEYEHDIDGKTEVVRDKMGNATVYTYDDNGNILKTVDAMGNVTRNTYDGDNNVLTKTDALGFVESYSYDDKGQPVSYTDKNGKVTYYSYNNLGQVTVQTNPDESKNYITYDSAGNMLSESDKAGNAISYKYDAKGNRTQEKDANGNCINYTFDKEGNVTSYEDFAGNITSYKYDVKGNVTQEKITYADTGQSSVKTYEYDQYDNKTAEYNNGVLIGSSTYDINGNVITESDKNGNRTEYEYYNSGNVKKITDSNGYTEEYTYDLNGNKTSYTDKKGNVTNYTYDTLGRVKNIEYADGASENYIYNDRSEVTQYTNKLGLVESYTYDAKGNNIEKTNSVNGTTKYSYDSMNRVIEMEDANGAVTKYEYDINGNQTKVTYADNTFEEYEYDSSLNKTSYKDREGKEYKYSYDVSGNLVSVTDSKKNVTKYEYDAAGNKLSETDANNNKTTYTYDVNGNLISKTLPGGQSNSYHYNIDNELDYVTDYNGNKTNYSYFTNGKLEKVESETGEYKEYEYYDDGTVKSITTENGTESYSWNNGKLASKTDINNESLIYTYDVDDNVTSITSSEGTLYYTYDQLARLKNVIDYEGRVTSYEYDNIGNLTKETLSNGVKTEYVYNSLSELTKVLTTNEADEIISSYDYELGAGGERKKVVDNKGNVIEYTYDESYQLTEEKTTSADGRVFTTQYTYDAVGNRTCISKNGAVTNYIYDANDRLIQEGDISYTYDANGNLTTKTDETGVTTYGYNSYDQLIDVAVDGASTVSYKYDTGGNRIYKKTADSEDTFVFDTNREVSQIITQKSQTDTDTDIYKYVYGDKLVSQEVDNQISYYLIDGQLSIRKLIDSSGNITDNYDYDAFGNLTSSTGTTNNEFLYTGQQYDYETGLYYLRARYMDPRNGRFISRDFYDGNVFEPGTLHKYAYVSNDPVNNYDPQGLWLQKVIQGILAHRFINKKYILEHPGHIVNHDRKNGHISGFLRRGFVHKYVDIIDYTTGEIYEIKPYDGVVDGAAQVEQYMYILTNNIQTGRYFTGQTFKPGNSWPIPARVYAWPLGGAITVYLQQAGLIYYKVTRSDADAYDNAYAWNMLKMPEFDVGYVDEFEVVAMLAASIPAIIHLVNQARRVDLTLSYVFI